MTGHAASTCTLYGDGNGTVLMPGRGGAGQRERLICWLPPANGGLPELGPHRYVESARRFGHQPWLASTTQKRLPSVSASTTTSESAG